MGFLLFLLRAPFVILWIVSSLLSVAVIYPFVPLSVRGVMNENWSRTLIFICGVHVRILGAPAKQGAALWVANHVSWIDIFILSSIRCVAFIAKSEIRGWPILGWLVAKAGTVFIERGKRHSIRKVGNEMQGLFQKEQVVGLFAEGTTSSGFDVLPFRSSLFDPALEADAAIQPIALRFFHRGRRSDYVAFVGEQNMVQNLWVLLGTTQVAIEVEFLPALAQEQCREWGRNKVSAHCHHVISRAVRPGACDPDQSPSGV